MENNIKNTIKNRAEMTKEERAKQFMPFSALKGYEEALRKKEIECAKKAENGDLRKI